MFAYHQEHPLRARLRMATECFCSADSAKGNVEWSGDYEVKKEPWHRPHQRRKTPGKEIKGQRRYLIKDATDGN